MEKKNLHRKSNLLIAVLMFAVSAFSQQVVAPFSSLAVSSTCDTVRDRIVYLHWDGSKYTNNIIAPGTILRKAPSSISGTGTTNRIPLWLSSSSLTNSYLLQNSNGVLIDRHKNIYDYLGHNSINMYDESSASLHGITLGYHLNGSVYDSIVMGEGIAGAMRFVTNAAPGFLFNRDLRIGEPANAAGGISLYNGYNSNVLAIFPYNTQSNITYYLPSVEPTEGQVLADSASVTGNAYLYWKTQGGTISGLTTNYIPVAGTPTSIENSFIYQSGNTLNLTNASDRTLQVQGATSPGAGVDFFIVGAAGNSNGGGGNIYSRGGAGGSGIGNGGNNYVDPGGTTGGVNGNIYLGSVNAPPVLSMKGTALKLVTGSPAVGNVFTCTNVDGTGTWSAQATSGLDSALTSGNIFVGNSGNKAQGRALSLNATPGSFSLGNTGILTMPDAATATRGLLNSSDWNLFNGKQAAGNYITALTGDVTASGPGSASATLVNTAVTAASYGSSTSIPSFTVDGKGRLTAAAGNAVIAPAGTLTGSTLASGITASSLTSFGTNPTIGLANGTGLPVSTGISGLGTGVATLLATPSSANLASAITDETGSGAATFATSPDFKTIPTWESASAYGYQIRGRTDLTFPVPMLRPTTANKVLAFDLFPNGTFSESSGNGITWMDACDADDITNVNTARLGMGSTAAYIGSMKYGSASQKPLNIVVGTSNASDIVMTFDANKFAAHMDVSRASNYTSFYNNNPSASGAARIYSISDVAHIGLYSFGSTFSTSGMRIASQVSLLTDAAGQGMNIGTEGAYPLKFWTNNTERIRVLSGGNVGIGSTTPANVLDVAGDIGIPTAGKTLKIKTGTNACAGQATLSSGTVTVSTSCVLSGSIVMLTDATTGALTNVGSPTVGTIVNATSFVINSTNILDASNVNWFIVNPY